MNATAVEFNNASRRLGSCSASEYHLVVRPSNGNARMFESLNENATRIASGPNSARNTIARKPRHPHRLTARRMRIELGTDRSGSVQTDRLRDLRH